MLSKLIQITDRAIAGFLLLTVFVYKKLLAPVFGTQCRFHPTCSTYAQVALQQKNVFIAILLIIKRIAKCHPYHNGGFDTVE